MAVETPKSTQEVTVTQLEECKLIGALVSSILPDVPPTLSDAIDQITDSLYRSTSLNRIVFIVSYGQNLDLQNSRDRLDVMGVWDRPIDLLADAAELRVLSTTVGGLLQPFEHVLRSDSHPFDNKDLYKNFELIRKINLSQSPKSQSIRVNFIR